jgi:hypothetical protein
MNILPSKVIAVFLALFLSVSTSFASADSVNKDAFIGIHVNELVRQLLPNSSSSVNNGFNYLITYIQYKPGHKQGTRMGGNFIFNSFTDNINGVNRITNNNIFQYKVGKEKLYRFDKHFSFGYGWDLLISVNNSSTRSQTTINGNDLRTTTSNNHLSFGTGPGIRMLYNITPKVLLGTDVGAYFSTTFVNTIIVEKSQSQAFDKRSDESDLNYSLGIHPPISLYFILKIR